MPKDNKQQTLFEQKEWWEEHWQDMPEFVHDDLAPWKQIIVSFKCREDMKAFSELVGQTVTTQTQSIWYPKAKIDRYINKRYIDES